jgi:hypothetical protein
MLATTAPFEFVIAAPNTFRPDDIIHYCQEPGNNPVAVQGHYPAGSGILWLLSTSVTSKAAASHLGVAISNCIL